MKDGRTHLAYKAEHAVDLETGALVAVTLQDADQGDTTTIIGTAIAAAEQIEDAQAAVQTPQLLAEIIADKGYHSNQIMIELEAVGLRSYVGGAGPWSPRLVRGARSPDPGVCQSAADPWRARPAPCVNGASGSNAPSRICTTPVGCAARICAATPISSSAC